MFPIGNISRLDSLLPIFQGPAAAIKHYKPLIQKVYEFVCPSYKAGSAAFFAGYGIKEVVWDHQQSKLKHIRTSDINHKVLPSLGYPLVHGSLLITTGILSAFEALHAFACINLGERLSKVAAAGNLTFLFANLLALQENVTLYEQALALGIGATDEEIHQAETQKKSAVLGILSNLGYVASSAIALLGASSGLILVLACFGSCWGGLKVLYDFYLAYFSTKESKQLLRFDLQEKALKV